MPRSNRPPSYRLHRARNCAVVILHGQNHYLGPYGSPESHEKYARLIAEWHAGGNRDGQPVAATVFNETISVSELILAYWRFAKSHYQRAGKPTGTLVGIRVAVRPLHRLYGSTSAGDFGPKKLKAVRRHMVDLGLSRSVINSRIGRIKRMFKWAVAEELVAPSVHHGLQAVAGLTFGRTTARETEPVRPVPDLYVAAILPFVTPIVAAMVRLQRLTGMRSGELVIMRPCDIDISGDIWVYEPSDHKGRWRGHPKQIPLARIIQVAGNS